MSRNNHLTFYFHIKEKRMTPEAMRQKAEELFTKGFH